MSDDLHLFRTLPEATPLHRVDASTKLASLALVSVAVSVHPTGVSLAILCATVAVAVGVTRPPAGAWPRLPRWIWVLTAVAAGISALGGGAPYVDLGPVRIGLEGLVTWLRVAALTFGLGIGAIVIGWTTPLAELAPGLRRLLRPFAAIGLPVDLFVTTLGLAIRCVPLLVDEVRSLLAARRSRHLPRPASVLDAVGDVADVMIAALVVALRRGEDMATAIESRGGLRPAVPSTQAFHRGDVVTAVVAGVAAVAILLN